MESGKEGKRGQAKRQRIVQKSGESSREGKNQNSRDMAIDERKGGGE